MPEYYLGIHCHYYQPPRGNPFSNQIPIESDAEPYLNWNARITAECYQPNAAMGNLKHVSFDIGEALARWLAENAPEVYHAFIQADAANIEQFGVGNAVAQPLDHVILPLSRREDKTIQVRWGIAVFEYRFGRKPTGMWLPEMAVDYETLEVLVEEGIEWTILTESQVEGKPVGGGPFWIRLPNRKRN
jgi:alpha-amylase/alpha-mannosidase (GH57 family)